MSKNKKIKKNISRLYIQGNFQINDVFFLSKKDGHYVKTVLRMQVGDILEIFNNTNYIFFSEIIYILKDNIKIKIFQYQFKNIESPLYIHLGQVISHNENMDFTIQKSIEMGVNMITPLFSKYCRIKKNFNIDNKIKRWKKIIIAACKQCKRNIIPTINAPKDILHWCTEKRNSTKIIFHPESKLTMNHVPKSTKNIQIIIGAEGGFSKNEIFQVSEYGFLPIKLGPRILRTETASIVAITALQIQFGDLIY